MTETGEPYAAARRAVVTEYRVAGGQIPSPGAGCALRMSGEIHDWLADLRGSDPATAVLVGQALAALMTEGASLGDPLVASTADSWPWALGDALDTLHWGRLCAFLGHCAVRTTVLAASPAMCAGGLSSYWGGRNRDIKALARFVSVA